jgi:type I restriction enzyme M protein
MNILEKASSRDKDYGLIMTPKSITNFVIALLKPTISDKILDPAVGFGNFLNRCWSYVEKHRKDSEHID